MSAINKRGARRVVGTDLEKARTPNAVSYNGNPQFAKSSHQQLIEAACMTMFGKDSFYESNDSRVKRLREHLVDIVNNGSDMDFHFVANVIYMARTDMNMRTMPIVLTVEFAKALHDANVGFMPMRRVVRDVIRRADQITDMYAYALDVFGTKNKIPMAIKRGVGDAFNKFNEYQIGKYNTGTKAVKMRDVLRIVHPKAINAEKGMIFQKIMDENVDTPYTWETELSANGQLPESEQKSKKQLWTELLKSGKVGYMALLRNIRNIEEAGVDSTVKNIHLYKVLADRDNVLKSKQLPFRFLTAMREVKKLGSNVAVKALTNALDHSMSNVPVLGKNVWIIVDESLSMSGDWDYVGGKASCRKQTGMSPLQMASIFAAGLAKANSDAENLQVTMFSDYARNIAVNPDLPVMENAKLFESLARGGGTNLQAALDQKNTLGFEPDTVVVLSDMQVNRLRGSESAQIFAPGTVKIAVNLDGYNSTPLSELSGWYQVGGWSDKIFDFAPAMREGASFVDRLRTPYIGDTRNDQ